jgi:plasmid stabilization system protein ParE
MYRVRWTRKASNQLAAIWTNAADQNAITVASHRIDQALASDPENQGEDRPNNRRVMFEPPLLVFYRIDNSNNTVIVSFVGRYGTSSP